MAQRILYQTVKSSLRPQEVDQIFEEIFQLHWRKVYAILERLVGDAGDAEDLALEAFWRFYTQIKSEHYLSIVNVGGWLYRVALRLGYNALRSRQRRSHYEKKAGKEAVLSIGFADPVLELEQSQQRERVQITLSKMKERSAKLLILRHSGLSYAEIANALQVKVNSVGTLLARAEKEFEQIFLMLDEKV